MDDVILQPSLNDNLQFGQFADDYEVAGKRTTSAQLVLGMSCCPKLNFLKYPVREVKD